jgi:hypothetical protein
MFDQVFEAVRKATDSAIVMQQELFNKWISLWPGVPISPAAVGEAPKFQKKWVDAVGELIKKQREILETQFSTGVRSIEEAFHLAEAKDPEELRAKTVALWQKIFDCLRQTHESQVRDFQIAVSKWAEVLTKGAA